ncbi:MAG: alkaline phosphatase D family protein [Chthoniobacterales bacterium]
MRSQALLLLALLVGTAAASAQETAAPVTRIAFGSCNREYKPQPLWPAILACQPEVWIWLGDIVYGQADQLEDLARRYRSEKERPEYQTLRRQARVLGVWDDNDFGVSNGGAENPNKQKSQALLLDFLDESPESPRRAQAGVYAASTFGPPGRQVKVILLDGRYHREAPAKPWDGIVGKPAADADILGPEQWVWLEEQLTHSTADIHLIGSGIQVLADEHAFEKWGELPQARARLFNLLAKTKARNVIFLSGDRHLAEISRAVDPRLASPLYDITSSGMTHHATNGFLHNFERERNRFRVGRNYIALNFGLIEIDWNASPPVVTAQIRGVDNVVALEEKITLAPVATESR